MEFDLMRSYQIYFPHNNIELIMFKIRKRNPLLYNKNLKTFSKFNTKKS